ncbi:MAG: type II toxin-antitoxin system RelE/ParE family toxin [Oscillospiraceae bacterium]|nr:type II toxin-antitoxin system RelE/ParE family toxin [Oscillospiraceae bacterium]
MHKIIFYEDANGNSPVYEYLLSLARTGGKESRIRLHKAQDYINVLKTYGKTAGEPYMKHLDGDIWELRPTSDRILFAGIVNDSFVLLHQFQKKTQKTPSREIEKAKKELADYIERSGE